MSGALKSLIRREIRRQNDIKTGTVLSEMRLSDFDSQGIGVFVTDIEIGSNHYLRNVPVKGIKGRFHAQLGQSVELRKNAQGRWEVTGPGGRVALGGGVKTYELVGRTQQSATTSGWISSRVAFSYYATADPGAPLQVVWNNGTTPFGYVQIIAA